MMITLHVTKRQKAGELLSGRRFTAAMRAEETEDFAFLDAEDDIVTRREATEAPNEMLGGDGNFSVHLGSHSHGFQFPALSFTSAAMPARTWPAGSLMRIFTPMTW